jgi:hypothetical protein
MHGFRLDKFSTFLKGREEIQLKDGIIVLSLKQYWSWTVEFKIFYR